MRPGRGVLRLIRNNKTQVYQSVAWLRSMSQFTEARCLGLPTGENWRKLTPASLKTAAVCIVSSRLSQWEQVLYLIIHAISLAIYNLGYANLSDFDAAS